MSTPRDPAMAALAQVMDRLHLSYTPEPNGSTTVYFDGLRIVLVPEGSRLRFMFKLSDLPAETRARENQLREAARVAAGNLANLESTRETLTVSENANEMLLFRVVAVDQMEVDQYLENLAQFVDAAEYWQRALGA